MSRKTDALAASRLPDLPDAGYSTIRQKQTTDAIMFFMRGVERNRKLLLGIVCDGKRKWRTTAGRVWRGLLVNTEILDSIYQYFCWQAGRHPRQQLELLNQIEQRQPTIAHDAQRDEVQVREALAWLEAKKFH